MDILDDMGASKLSTKVVSKVNYSFNKHLCTSGGHIMRFWGRPGWM